MMNLDHPGVSIHIDRATVVITDTDEVTISFQSPEMFVLEDVGQVVACIDLRGSTEKTITYSIATQPDSAQGKEFVTYNNIQHAVTCFTHNDYVMCSCTDTLDYSFDPSHETFAFMPSANSVQQQCHSIAITDDTTLESTEQFSVQLSTNVSRVNVNTDLMQVEIEDNDRVTIGFNETAFLVLEEEPGGASITICTVLTGNTEKNIVVNLFTESSSTDGE